MSFVAVGVAAAMATISAVMQGIQAKNAAQAERSAAEYNAQVANNNAVIDAQQRSSTLQQGEAEAHKSMRDQAQMIGAQRAQMAANGIDLTQGSAQDLLASTKFLGGIDVNTIQSNAARQAWGYEVQGMNDRSAGIMEKWKADSINPTEIGLIAGGTSLLSSIGGAASTYAGSKGGGSSGRSAAKVNFGSNTGGGTGGGWPTK
jgi:hypothetical protein